MASWREPALAIGATVEALAVIAALDGMAALAVACHLGACSAIALGLGQRVPVGARALVVATTVFLPILGALGWLAVASVRPAGGDRTSAAHVRTPIPGPEDARILASRPRLSGHTINARVLAARGCDDPASIALLRRALTDREEDVRLVAHAMLESKHCVAYASVYDRERELEAARDGRVMLHQRLAAEDWELARTGLAEGDCLAHALERARHHARAAAAERPSAALCLLMARVELLCGNATEADAALTRALELGLPPAIAAPYLTEADFLARRFDLAHRLAAEPEGHAALDRIRRFWS